MWGSRFGAEPDADAQRFNASIDFDQRLAPQDVRASMAWARALVNAGVLSTIEGEEIQAGLREVASELERRQVAFLESDEDIHSVVERRLAERIGELAGKLHTGRSRNDQVATDLRLWITEHAPRLDGALADLQAALLERAEADMALLVPGYTHLQRAQPILVSHWWLSHFWPLLRDRQRFQGAAQSAARLPLGSAALAGTAFPIDRKALAADLGFAGPCPNSLDAVSDRDFALEFLFSAAVTAIHLSRLAEGFILYTSREFGFFELHDAYATGSSLMPHKKNPDVFELARGKTGPLVGALTGLLVTLKGLPSAYDKDLQEDKLPVFHAYDTLAQMLPVLAGALRTLTVHPERMAASLDDDLLTTDLADDLVRRGVAFRQAHDVIGRWVRLAHEQGRPLRSFTLDELQALHPLLDREMYALFDPAQSVARRRAIGGTAPSAVAEQLADARQAMASLSTYPNHNRSPGSRGGLS